jgi:hypothetical protein
VIRVCDRWRRLVITRNSAAAPGRWPAGAISDGCEAMIGLVSESLKNLLEREMTPATNVTVLSPIEASSHQTRVNLFLYRVIPNPHLRNRDFLPKPGTSNRLLHPPLALNLFYLLTAVAPLDVESGQATAHAIMAEAIRVLHEHPIVPQLALENGLRQGQVKVTLHSADVEELSKIWTSLEKDLQLSAIYEVSFTEIPARGEHTIPRRVEKTDVVVAAADRRPAITHLSPRSGPSGSTIQVRGESLRGWKVTSHIGGAVAVRNLPLFDDTAFELPVPPLVPGLYELDIDISGLTRFADTFEVTP